MNFIFFMIKKKDILVHRLSFNTQKDYNSRTT